MKLLIAGFVLSLIGSLPPGLISLTVSHTAIRKGLMAALILGAGAAFAEYFQAFLAVWLSEWLLSRPAIETGFRVVALLVFLSLAVYLIFFARSPRAPEKTPVVHAHRQFLQGIGISAFNLMAIPYWFTYCGWLKMEGYWEKYTLPSTLVFSLGVSTGTFAAMALYAWLGALIVKKADAVARYANPAIGFVFLFLSVKLLLSFFP